MFKFLSFLMASTGLLFVSAPSTSSAETDAHDAQCERHVCVSQCGHQDEVECPSDSEKSCHLCYGTGLCWSCGGDGWFYSPYTGDPLDCPNCTDGSCSKCGGTGRL